MATEKRLIDANALTRRFKVRGCFKKDMLGRMVAEIINNAPTVDAVPVDEIRVDIMSLSLENQEAVLNVSICGRLNEVKLPFSKEVVEVAHGEWSIIEDDYLGLTALQCSKCNQEYWFEDEPPMRIYNYCPNCGAKMDLKGE